MKATGRKDDSIKPQMHLIPKELDLAAARAFGYGAGKYDEYNWMGGIQWGRLFSAIKRHLDAWWSREDSDPESGLSHLDHAAAGLGMLIATSIHRPDLDNRPPNWEPRKEQQEDVPALVPLSGTDPVRLDADLNPFFVGCRCRMCEPPFKSQGSGVEGTFGDPH